MKVLLSAFLLAVCSFATPAVHALVIDDFTVGAVTLTASPDVVAQTNLDPAHVVGGARHVTVERTPTKLTISPTTGMLVEQPSGWGYFTLMYGYDAPLNANFAANGHDRLRLVVNAEGSETAAAGVWISINTELPPRSDAPGPNSLNFRGGAIIEIPFSIYGTNFADVDTFAIYVLRMTSGFSLHSVSTAGPPLAGDFNRDGLVNGGDLDEFRRTFGQATGHSGGYHGYLSADENRDGKVDGSDFLAWQRAAFSAPVAVSVPEPAAISLAMGGLLLLRMGRRKFSPR